jgi:polyhydroxybutyrate depolymerase
MRSCWIASLILLPLLLPGCRRRTVYGRCDPGAAPCDGDASLSVGGRERSFVYHLPSTPGADRRPLLVALHGHGGDGRAMARLTGLDAVADEDGFVVVFPDGHEKSWNDGRGRSPASEADMDDVGFVSAIVDHAVARLRADPRRVYVTGMSNGGMMSHRIGCELAAKVAGIAPVAGTLPQRSAPGCSPAKPISVVMFHGTDDGIVPYGGGEVARGAGGRVLSAEATLAKWAALDGCAAGATTVEEPDRDPGDGTRVERAQHACPGGREVALYTIRGGGHTWPGGAPSQPEAMLGRTSRDIDASRLIPRAFGISRGHR